MPRPASQSWKEYLGPGAVASLLLAVVTAIAGLGLPILWRLRQVLQVAARDDRRSGDAVLILGRSLDSDQLGAVFRARLDHGLALWREGLADHLIVAGGLTGSAVRSEAVVGKEYLEAQGAPASAVVAEDRSRHTLENLFFVREKLRECGWRRLLVVSDPLHLARTAALARGLGMVISTCPAVAAPPKRGGLGWWSRALREAGMLHWYHVGVAYSRLIGSEKLLSRVR